LAGKFGGRALALRLQHQIFLTFSFPFVARQKEKLVNNHADI
jgi:hypothetical protein